jgi:cell division protease FtsH
MARFEIKVEGAELGRAMGALNEAGIPTIASGPDFPAGSTPRPVFRRMLRSSAFWILTVIVLAFIAQRLLDPGTDENAPSYDQFLVQVNQEPETIAKVTLEPDDTTLEAEQRNGIDYRIGYPPRSEDTLVDQLQRQHIETVVKPTGGGNLLSLLVYFAPFLLFLGFFTVMMRRMKQERQGSGEWRLGGLRASVEADSPEAAMARVSDALPADSSYRLDKPVQ